MPRCMLDLPVTPLRWSAIYPAYSFVGFVNNSPAAATHHFEIHSEVNYEDGAESDYRRPPYVVSVMLVPFDPQLVPKEIQFPDVDVHTSIFRGWRHDARPGAVNPNSWQYRYACDGEVEFTSTLPRNANHHSQWVLYAAIAPGRDLVGVEGGEAIYADIQNFNAKITIVRHVDITAPLEPDGNDRRKHREIRPAEERHGERELKKKNENEEKQRERRERYKGIPALDLDWE